MREIKFRAWNKAVGKMNHFNKPVLKIAENSGIFFEVKEEQVYMSKYSELSQYTGLKDCNDNEIYEGDIVRVEVDEILTVIFNEGAFCAKGDSYIVPLLEIADECEIIGNIYENPEIDDYIKAERAGKNNGM